MITNERQYKISKAQLLKLGEAIKAFDVTEVVKKVGSNGLAQAELAALKSEEETLSAQIKEYDALKSGALTIFRAQSIEKLPRILIQARIAQGLSQRQLAEKLGLKEQQIQRYEAEEYASASLRRLSEISDALKLDISEIAQCKQISSSVGRSIDWGAFPVKEMLRRNWFTELYSGSFSAAMSEAESLVKAYITNVFRQPTTALFRRHVRSGSVTDPYAFLAWQSRILTLAKKSPPKGAYTATICNDAWLKRLVQESCYPDGPVRAKQYLAEAGISLVIEPQLPNMRLDGAAFLHGDMFIIGLSLRYDRLDSFWFVLVHELIHMVHHLRKGRLENIFDDIDAVPDELEKTTDELAGKVLISDQIWEIALARYFRSKESVLALAKELNINPAIIAGRVRKEANDYTFLNSLVGHNEVRKHFPEVSF